jgi:hypothetical protein
MIAHLSMLQGAGLPPDLPGAELVVPVVGIVFGTITTMVLGFPIIRAVVRAFERRSAPAPQIPPDVSARLAAIEQAVESIAIEVERISEGQRFLTRLQTDQRSLGAPGPSPPR